MAGSVIYAQKAMQQIGNLMIIVTLVLVWVSMYDHENAHIDARFQEAAGPVGAYVVIRPVDPFYHSIKQGRQDGQPQPRATHHWADLHRGRATRRRKFAIPAISWASGAPPPTVGAHADRPARAARSASAWPI